MVIQHKVIAFFAVALGLVTVSALPLRAASCDSLASLILPNTTITSAKNVSAGAFFTAGQPSAEFRDLPAFCRVTATLAPSSDSDIKIEVWMPSSRWNRKFQAVGNGGWAGIISYPALAAALKAGYASASTDTGHEGNSGAFGMGHPEKVVDFAYRAIHEMTTQAKAIINAFYTETPTLSLWNGCSTGGRQGITEAAKYPSDFDAVLAGAPAINQMHLHIARLAINVFVHRNEDTYIPPMKYSFVHEQVLKACDALDGVKDGVIENPAACHFDPKVLVCKGADASNCLTPAQVQTAQGLYAPVRNPLTGKEVTPALLQPGSELGWAILAGPAPLRYAVEAFKYLVFKNPDWDWHQFDAATDIELALKADNGLLDFTDVDLRPFFDRGGKLLMYHGWSDPQVTPMGSINYFNNVITKLGSSVVGKSIELYMVPGMNHCQGGPGPDTFDKMGTIEQWVAKGTAPEKLLATHLTNGTVDRTRPLCPYPQVASYEGAGSTEDAANFVCKTP